MVEPNLPFKVKAIFDYKSDYEDDLPFTSGQILTITAIENDEWYTGEYDGKSGMFPKNFVEILTTPTIPVSNRPIKKAEPQSETQESKTDSSPTNISKSPPTAPIAEEKSQSSPKSNQSSSSRVPMPQSFHSKPSDPYSIKKQFVAAAPSSYVPKITPRDESNLVAHPTHDTKQSDNVVKGTSVNENESTEESGPKVSLKERIALLQRKQQEEAEREEAALKRKEERAKKQAEEKERVKHLREQKSGEAQYTHKLEDHHPELEGAVGTKDDHDVSSVADSSKSIHDDANHLHEPTARSPSVGEPEEADEVNFEKSGEQDIDEDEEEQEEEDDEELKRKKLVERMAKISGGRNMFGMMGMPSPFGNTPSADTQPKKTKATPAAPTPESPVREPNATSEAAPSSAPEVPPHASAPKFSHESSSMAEDDEPSDSDQAEIITSNDIKQQLNHDDIHVSDSADDQHHPIRLKKYSTLEGEGTGYEADEDLSDITKPHDNHNQHPLKSQEKDSNETITLKEEQFGKDPTIPHPPIHPTPTSRDAPPIPPVPAVPPVPSRDANSVPPVPSRAAQSNFAPPVPPNPPSSHSTENQPHPPKLPSTHDRPPPPPPPTHQLQEEEETSSSEDDNFEIVERQPPTSAPPTRAETFESHHHNTKAAPPPPIPGAVPPPPIPIGEPPKRATTDISPLVHTSTGASINSLSQRQQGSRKSTDSTLSRSRSLKGSDQSQAEIALEQLEFEISNIKSTSDWWLKNGLPDPLVKKIGVDLIYEVDSNKLSKRGSRSIICRDFYILFYDLSQLILDLEYEESDPRNTIHLVNQFIKSNPVIRTDLLESNHRQFSSVIVNTAAQLIGQNLNENFINYVFNNPEIKSKILHPIGNKSFGVTIYKNFNNTNISKIDDIKPGDILWIKNGKFDTHKGLIGNKSISVGDDGNNSFTAIIYEFDPKKEKFKVIEQDNHGHISKESYKLNEFKGGRIRVFRPVSRQYVDW
ncbi:uncharacterized protein KGF55_003047 [Candida pseudojiufengensis]|uniref:uncharacterized protein n=1 Tax=Candida pseudojiufengensis TaxID=497109 RepID=UPI0022252ACA|nr:uncharacterized protein KGF55_003047 [Candida pseudojiufengensis]KAI5963255.1 hypothetical protein KGF55_003047 [Candida pseudojiufengensis]